jgi:hypothetical protein
MCYEPFTVLASSPLNLYLVPNKLPNVSMVTVRMSTVSTESGKNSWLLRPLPIVLATCAVLAFRLFLTIRTEAVNIFYWDQWDFNDPILFHPQPLWQAFLHQHGPHRQGLGAFAGLVVGRLSQWNTRTDAFAIGITVVIASLCALWLKKRLFGFLGYSDVIIPMLFFTRVQWETYLGTTNPAHGSLPLLLIVLYCLAWTCRPAVLKYALVLFLNFLAIYTGFGLFLGFVTPVLLAVESYNEVRNKHSASSYALAACLLSIVSIASFFVGYVREPDCFSFIYSHPASYLLFVSMMFSGFLAARGYYFSAVTGSVVLAIFLAAVIIHLARMLGSSNKERNISASIIIVALLGFSLLFGTGTATGRVCVESSTGQTSRYMIYLVPAFLGIYLHTLLLQGKLRQVSITILLVLSFLASFPTGVAHKGQMEKARLVWKNCYLSLEDVEQCDEITSSKIYPAPEATQLKQKLLYLKQHRLNLYAK